MTTGNADADAAAACAAAWSASGTTSAATATTRAMADDCEDGEDDAQIQTKGTQPQQHPNNHNNHNDIPTPSTMKSILKVKSLEDSLRSSEMINSPIQPHRQGWRNNHRRRERLSASNSDHNPIFNFIYTSFISLSLSPSYYYDSWQQFTKRHRTQRHQRNVQLATTCHSREMTVVSSCFSSELQQQQSQQEQPDTGCSVLANKNNKDHYDDDQNINKNDDNGNEPCHDMDDDDEMENDDLVVVLVDKDLSDDDDNDNDDQQQQQNLQQPSSSESTNAPFQQCTRRVSFSTVCIRCYSYYCDNLVSPTPYDGHNDDYDGDIVHPNPTNHNSNNTDSKHSASPPQQEQAATVVIVPMDPSSSSWNNYYLEQSPTTLTLDQYEMQKLQRQEEEDCWNGPRRRPLEELRLSHQERECLLQEMGVPQQDIQRFMKRIQKSQQQYYRQRQQRPTIASL